MELKKLQALLGLALNLSDANYQADFNYGLKKAGVTVAEFFKGLAEALIQNPSPVKLKNGGQDLQKLLKRFPTASYDLRVPEILKMQNVPLTARQEAYPTLARVLGRPVKAFCVKK